MRGVRNRSRGRKAVPMLVKTGIVMQAAGVVTTDVSSNNPVTVLGDTWLLQGPWADADQIVSLSTTDIE